MRGAPEASLRKSWPHYFAVSPSLSGTGLPTALEVANALKRNIRVTRASHFYTTPEYSTRNGPSTRLDATSNARERVVKLPILTDRVNTNARGPCNYSQCCE